MQITPLDIRQQKFSIKFRGFDIHEVDLFLEQMAETLELLQQAHDRLQDKLRRARAECKGYREREDTFKRAMLTSQKAIEQMKENARKSGELIVAEAEVKADKILNKAHSRFAGLQEDIAELKRQRVQMEVQIGSVIEAHSKLLDLSKEEMISMDTEDSKLKVLNPK